MKVLGIIVLVLALLWLLPLGGRIRYDHSGLCAWLKVWFVPIQLLPAKKKPRKADKEEKKPKKAAGKQPEPEPTDKKGGPLDTVQAALPLLRPALQGVKKRLTIRRLDLRVTWAAADPADAAVGYGRAQAALGALWALVDQNFKVKKSSLGCQVDFDQTSPRVYADAVLTLRLGQLLTLALPLLVRFVSNSSRLKRERAEKIRKEA